MSALALQIGMPGTQEMIIILLIAVLLFGANKIPKLARSTGQAMGEFQKGRQEVEEELQQMDEGETGGGAAGADTTASTSEVESESASRE